MSVHIIVDPNHSVLELNLTLSYCIFNGWFGIPFQNTFSFTYTRSPRPAELLTLYGLNDLTPFYTIIIFPAQIRLLVLNILH